ncbi:sulfotransferase family 2 domain-containing protein (plasmid) [Aminobacter sp. BA135]|uniref:sulfotransferase family 2 domain-containing protein n=1 Tax=Aminobacter sp. BA135 TaxID=537596 RepID=UPI003D7B50E8
MQSAEYILSDDAPEYVNWRLRVGSFVSPDLKYVYMDTPKCACTATKMHLWEFEGLPKRAPWPATVHERIEGDGRISLLDLPKKDAIFALTSPSVVRFYVYRKPEHRIASAYMNKIADLDLDAYANPRFAIQQKYDLGHPSEITLDQFAEFSCDTDDNFRDAHWQSQNTLLLANLIDYNHAIDMEDYADGMEEVFYQIGDIQRRNFREVINKTGSKNHLISAPILSKIREAYAQDYLLAPEPSRWPGFWRLRRHFVSSIRRLASYGGGRPVSHV